MNSSFDRVRARDIDHQPPNPSTLADPDGKSVLFSSPGGQPGPGHVAITCSACQQLRVLSYWAALRQAIPSLHVPLVRRPHDWWLRCPACHAHHWVSVAFRSGSAEVRPGSAKIA